ncbi:MAG: FtsX-like permease family protein [Roseivirga sp.]|nr:FtsX-like permease family protein [Roseivirga sp.]
MSKNHKVPAVPHAFFKWYCKRDRYEELHGDLEEFFYENITERGLLRARLYYLSDIIRCCQPYAWKKPKVYSNAHIIMIRNYFKTALRSALRNPLSSFINVFGLSVAIGICLVVYAFMKNDADIDRFHEHKDKVFLTTFYADRNGDLDQYGATPAPLAKMLEQDQPHIEKVGRLKNSNVVVKYGDHVFYELLKSVDPEFLEMLTFPLKWGDPGSLKDLNSVILSENASVKYFGDKNPLGEEILIKYNSGEKKFFKVTGVAKAFPDARIIDFNFLVNFENVWLADPAFDSRDWRDYVGATLIQLDDPAAIDDVKAGMEKYRELQNPVGSDWAIASFDFHSIHNLHYSSADIINGISNDTTSAGRLVLPIIGLFMLALACFNYINMAIGSAAKRLKEIGVRKVIGANKGRVVVQFLAENIFMTFFALLIGIILSVTLFLPWFGGISDMQMDLSLMDANLWVFLISLLLVTGIISGAYPAFYIARFQAVKIFKGSTRFGKKNPLTKVFLAFQLILACITITGAVTFTQNTQYQSERSWGYNQEETLYATVTNGQAHDQLAAVMSQNPDIVSMAGTTHHLGRGYSQAIVQLPERKYEVIEMYVSPQYFETMGLPLKHGRTFEQTPLSDQQALVVNETFVRRLGLSEPVDHIVNIDSTRYQIIGVVKDAHAYNFGNPIRPTIYRVALKDNYYFLTMQARPGKQIEVLNDMKEEWLKLFPEEPLLGGLQEDVWTGYFERVDSYERFNKAIAMVAVLLAGLGLYGLVSLNVSGRIREFSIRKVLGASRKHIASNIARQYTVLTIIALLIGAPVSYMLVEAELNLLFVYALPMNFYGVIMALLVLVSVLIFVIGTRVFKVSRANPVNGLRTE